MSTTTKANSKPRRPRQNAEDAPESPITRKGGKRVPENESSATNDSRAFNDGSTQLNKIGDPPSGRSHRGGRLVVASIAEIPAKQRGRKAKAKAK